MTDLRVTSDAPPASMMFPIPSEAALQQLYIGKRLADLENLPAAIVDVAVVRKNCDRMLALTEKLGMGFRAHIKTHKCLQVTRMQVGETSKLIKLIVSTVAELEYLVPFLLECQKKGRMTNVLYGVPAPPSVARRLRRLRAILGPESISLMIDNPEQLDVLQEINLDTAQDRVPVYIKIDTGYHRAGISPQSHSLKRLMERISEAEANRGKEMLRIKLLGFYSHMGNSYGVNSSVEALDHLAQEILLSSQAANFALLDTLENTRYTISVGATPTASSAQNLLSNSSLSSASMSVIAEVQNKYDIELHAGVYPFLDLQQLATHCDDGPALKHSTKTYSDMALRILAEVASVYSEREKPEALIAAGSLAIGREPCKSYPGWGIVSPTRLASTSGNFQAPFPCQMPSTGWMLDRISQEHGILSWQGSANDLEENRLRIGEKVLIYVNHACIAASGFGWYLVIDSEASTNAESTITDVWVRWRGW